MDHERQTPDLHSIHVFNKGTWKTRQPNAHVTLHSELAETNGQPRKAHSEELNTESVTPQQSGENMPQADRFP